MKVHVALKIKLKIKQGTSEKRKYGNIFYKSPSEFLCSCESFRVKTDKVFKGGLLQVSQTSRQTFDYEK